MGLLASNRSGSDETQRNGFPTPSFSGIKIVKIAEETSYKISNWFSFFPFHFRLLEEVANSIEDLLWLHLNLIGLCDKVTSDDEYDDDAIDTTPEEKEEARQLKLRAKRIKHFWDLSCWKKTRKRQVQGRHQWRENIGSLVQHFTWNKRFGLVLLNENEHSIYIMM